MELTQLYFGQISLCRYDNEYMHQFISNDKVKGCHLHATKRFIDDLGTLKDGGLFNDVYKETYSPVLRLKVEHSGTHATLLNLCINVKAEVHVYKLFDKRNVFPFISFACLTLLVTSPNQYFILLLLVNFLE